MEEGGARKGGGGEGERESVLCLPSHLTPQLAPHHQLIEESFLRANPHFEPSFPRENVAPLRANPPGGTKEADVAADSRADVT